MTTAHASTWPQFTQAEIDAVTRVLQSGKVNQWTGDDVQRFEDAFARYLNAKHAVAVTNGTVSLELLLRAWGIGPGDEVIVTPRSFVASATTVMWVGATPVFADVDLNTQALSAETIALCITPKTKAILLVHLGGHPADLDEILSLAQSHDLFVLEDCAQAHGAEYKGKKLGTLGHAGSYSFCQDKIMTLGGEGGLINTNDEDTFTRVWELKDHGKSRYAVFEQEHPPGFRWLHHSLGTNLRLTAMQAALGVEQLQRLDDMVAHRTRNAAILTEALQDLPAVRLPTVPDYVKHAWYKYYAFVRPERLKSAWSRDRILHELNARGIPGLSGSCSEMYQEQVFTRRGLGPASPLPNARALGETSLMFLVDPTISHDGMAQNAAIIREVLQQASLG